MRRSPVLWITLTPAQTYVCSPPLACRKFRLSPRWEDLVFRSGAIQYPFTGPDTNAKKEGDNSSLRNKHAHFVLRKDQQGGIGAYSNAATNPNPRSDSTY